VYRIASGVPEHARHVAIRVVHIAEESRPCRAVLHAGRLFSNSLQLNARCALLHNVLFGIEGTHSVRARHHAVPAPNALFLVDQNNSILALEGCACRANPDAFRFLALLAERWQKVHLKIGKRPSRSYGENLSEIHAQVYVVFLLARDLAPFAADATVKINH
jgi:hypothetical protein